MDEWKRMHCSVLFLPALVMITATHSSAAHWQYPAANYAELEDMYVVDVQRTHKPESVLQT